MAKRNGIAAPVLRQETIDLPEIGAPVVVRGMRLAERLELQQAVGKNRQRYITFLLATTVCHPEDGLPLWTEDQWEIWGGANIEAVSTLLDVAQRLSGLDAGAARKN